MMVQRSIRRVWGHKPTDEEVIPVDNLPLTQEGYRGFGSVRGESLDEFHERMFDLDPLEAMMYELEVALEQSHDHPPYPTE